MTALTDRIAAVLDDHSVEFNPSGHINGTVPGLGTQDCFCGEVFADFGDWAAHVAQRIEAELIQAGFALVDRKTLEQLTECYGDEFVDGLTSTEVQTPPNTGSAASLGWGDWNREVQP